MPPDDFPVVAMVGSAGGLDAVSRVLGGLPEGFGAAVVVLIHQPPDRPNVLVDLLAGRCLLPVGMVHDDDRLEPGTVSVIPPGAHLLINRDLRMHLIVSGAAPPSRPSADLLLASMATALGRRAVAVVLSGHGHDGATGATAVHKLGGTVIASDEGSSEVFAMPQATIERNHAVNQIAAVEDIPPLLVALVAAPHLD